MAFSVGDVVASRYEVLESLGQRPLGWLYRAREREIGVEVALWVIGAGMLPDETARQAFATKISRAKGMSHANLVRVFGVYPTADEVVIAAQWAPGQTLFARVQEKPLTVDEARPIVAQVARAMTHAHQHGVVLGDVHTATVVLLGGTAKLSNVGIAPALPRKRFLEAVRDTQGYQRLPPELRSGMTLDARADVYSLAMLTLEMLTGGPDKNDRSVLDGPPSLKTVLGRALADDPMVRHTSVDALANELEAALSGQAPRPRRPTPPVGVPIAKEPKDDAPPSPDEVRPPSLETTRAIDPEELELLKGDQVTRQVPLDELLPLRAASSETQQVPLSDLIVEDDNYDELTLEQPTLPPTEPAKGSSTSDELKTDQVYRLEPDAAKTTEHPRLPPPIIEDEIDTQKVTRADVHEIVAPHESEEERAHQDDPKDPNLTPLPPPHPLSSTILTPPAMATPLEALADAKQAPTKVDKGAGVSGEPKIEVSGELPIEVVAPPGAGAPPKDEPLYDGDEAPTRTVFPDSSVAAQSGAPSNVPLPPPAPSAPSAALPPSPSKPTPAKPSTPPARPTPAMGSPTAPRPNTTPAKGSPAANVPTPIAASPSKRSRRNPFDPLPPEDDARTTEHRSPPPRARKNPFDAPSPNAPAARDAVEVGAGTVDVRGRKKKPRPTMVVPPLAHKSSAAPVLLVAVAAFIAAVGVALAISHYLTEQRLADERREKQRLADELNARAEAMRAKQAANPDTAPKPTVPVVTRAEPLATLLPRQGACPLGAHLVNGSHPYCIDVYEYPGGNTIPRTNVSFAEAGRICAARGERLCSESEWERACRGKGGASYPYGQAFEPTRCNTKGASASLSPTGAFQSCKSAVGAYDMSGNVAEWVASGAQKGGDMREGAKESRCSAVTRGAPPAGGPLVGFRCCADPTGKH